MILPNQRSSAPIGWPPGRSSTRNSHSATPRNSAKGTHCASTGSIRPNVPMRSPYSVNLWKVTSAMMERNTPSAEVERLGGTAIGNARNGSRNMITHCTMRRLKLAEALRCSVASVAVTMVCNSSGRVASRLPSPRLRKVAISGSRIGRSCWAKASTRGVAPGLGLCTSVPSRRRSRIYSGSSVARKVPRAAVAATI